MCRAAYRPIISSPMKIRVYIVMAAGTIALGILLTFIVLVACQRLGIDIRQNWWVLAIPAVLSLVINIALVELYNRLRKN